MDPETTGARAPEGALPLAIPAELWACLESEQRTLYHRAQRILDALDPEGATALRALATETDLETEDVLYALRTLDAMDLVSVGTDGRDVVVHLIAIPDEHVPVTAPDGSRRWLFVARPLVAPDIDPSALN